MPAGAYGYICMQNLIGTFLQLVVGYTLDGTEDTIWTHNSSNRHTKINVDFFQWLSIRIVKSGLCGKDAYTVLVKEMSWNWMTQE
jgi:hypothetical protein